MEIIGLILMVIGFITAIIGGLWFLVEVFKSGILWFIACLVCGIASLVWLITHWEDGKRPFGLQLLGWVVALIGMAMADRMDILEDM